MDEYSTNNYEDFIFILIIGLFLFEIIVGIVQLLGALVRTIICINAKQPIGKLKTYWIMVGVYFLILLGIYFAQHLVINTISSDTLSANGDYPETFLCYNYLMIAFIFWVFAAWFIAIWYCIKIVFVKHKNITQINNSIHPIIL